ncbi:MAG: arsenite methyltransferase [Porticoccaceae bacterium]|jgi:arsenite methyltransferase
MKNEVDKVSKEYSNAIDSEANTVVSKTGGAKFADYNQEDLSGLPEDIEEHSFGCGNPLAFSEVMPGQIVLDLGCGAGLDLLLASERVGSTGHVIGVDFNEDMLALAKTRINGYQNIELRNGRIEELPIDSNSVDWVISNCVINLSKDKQRAFNEISRVLKPSGKMIVSDIVAENLPWWVRHSGVLKAACGGGVISEKHYLDGLDNAGLENCQIVARQYYDPSQLVSIVSDAAPATLRKLRCCGKQVLHSVLTKFANPISKKLWSAKISANASSV